MNGQRWICFIRAFTIVCGRPKLVTKTFHVALYMTPKYPSPAIAALAWPLNVFKCLLFALSSIGALWMVAVNKLAILAIPIGLQESHIFSI